MFFHDHPCGADSNVCAILTCIVSTSLNDTKKVKGLSPVHNIQNKPSIECTTNLDCAIYPISGKWQYLYFF